MLMGLYDRTAHMPSGAAYACQPAWTKPAQKIVPGQARNKPRAAYHAETATAQGQTSAGYALRNMTRT